jgi:hypothetical protein
MKRHHLIGLIGVMFIMVALVVLMIPVAAQDEVGASVPPPPEVLKDFYDLWVTSPHADVTAEAFNHWNEDDPKEVPDSCGRCHSTPGYRDYLGADGTEYGVVDSAHETGTTITCDACHNSVTSSLTSVTFPSGVELTDLNDSSRCMVCHQGRASGLSVTAALEENGALADMNAVTEGLSFINIHYFAAAASLYGSEVHGGYEFPDMRYQRRNNHVEGVDTCIDCHDPHTLELQVDKCATCHEGVKSPEDFPDMRMNGSRIDYDGDGDVEEGIKGELETLQEMLLMAIEAYAEEVIGTPIAYDSASYPYWFDGAGERFTTFSGNLQIATYNYQVSFKDPGAFAHNPKYHIELMYDTIAMLNEQISNPIDLSNAHRNDPGHFDSTGEPYRHWDEEGEVSASCAKCHTADGLPFLLEHGVNISTELPDSRECSSCHSDVSNIAEGELRLVNEVTFPSGNVLTFGEEEPANLCINCHQGRESSKSIHSHIAGAGVGDDDVSADLRFRNPHYFAAGATLFGNDAAGGYQYDDMEYSGRFPHARRTDTCIGCHDPHALQLDVERCMDCHDNVETEEDIYMIRQDEDFDPVDYDGDGNVEEPILEEIHSFQDALYTAILAYADDNGAPISYNPGAYPYWFGEDGKAYANWTPRLVRTTYNYTWSKKDPGMFAHNADYIFQLLYDSIVDIGGEEAAASFTRAPINY